MLRQYVGGGWLPDHDRVDPIGLKLGLRKSGVGVNDLHVFEQVEADGTSINLEIAEFRKRDGGGEGPAFEISKSLHFRVARDHLQRVHAQERSDHDDGYPSARIFCS